MDNLLNKNPEIIKNVVSRDSNGNVELFTTSVTDISRLLEQENLKASGEIKKLNNLLGYLNNAIKELASAHDIKTVQGMVASYARKISQADGATLVLKENDLCYYADEDAIGPLWKGKKFLIKDCISGWVMVNKITAHVPDIYADDRIPVDAYKPTFVKSLLMVPILLHNEPVGAIGNYWSTHYTPSDNEIELLETLADAAARAIENVNLYHQLEQRVADRTEELKNAYKEMESFSYTVSHDLRTPLRAIIGFTELLKEEYADKLDDEGKRLTDTIINNTSKMGHLVDDLLKFSRLGRKSIELKNIDMRKLFRDAWDELHHHYKERNIKFNIMEMPNAHGDEILIKHVITNLLSNAIKFTKYREEGLIEAGVKSEDGYVVYYVKDNGSGFNQKYAEKMFEVFQRLHNEKDYEGTGIGLAIVHRIITMHGGKVWADGKENECAVFYFTLKQ